MSTVTPQQRLILVTGANKGIGFEVVKKLAHESSSNGQNVILLGSRDLKRGQDALQQLGSPPNVHILQLDTSSKESIARATEEIRQKYGCQLDVIVNNAGIALPTDTVEAARKTFATNYYGVKMLNEHLFPLLRDNARVANVASRVGPIGLSLASKELQDKYTSPTLTTTELDQLVADFLSAHEAGTLKAAGYSTELPYMLYCVSKAALIALTCVEARQSFGGKKVFVYSVCPGSCATDINNNAPGTRSAELGADSILYVVNTPAAELENGAFYQDAKKLPHICEDQAKVQSFIDMEKKSTPSK